RTPQPGWAGGTPPRPPGGRGRPAGAQRSPAEETGRRGQVEVPGPVGRSALIGHPDRWRQHADESDIPRVLVPATSVNLAGIAWSPAAVHRCRTGAATAAAPRFAPRVSGKPEGREACAD